MDIGTITPLLTPIQTFPTLAGEGLSFWNVQAGF